jgi:hypothetical protein
MPRDTIGDKMKSGSVSVRNARNPLRTGAGEIGGKAPDSRAGIARSRPPGWGRGQAESGAFRPGVPAARWLTWVVGVQ